jgi:integrase/recombinase XerD
VILIALKLEKNVHEKFGLMTRGGMRNLKPADIQERTLAVQNPKSGRVGEKVYVPRKFLVRLNDYVRANNFNGSDRIFPISYVAAWSMVKKAGQLVNIELRPHDLRRHAATYASRSGTPIEIASKVIFDGVVKTLHLLRCCKFHYQYDVL